MRCRKVRTGKGNDDLFGHHGNDELRGEDGADDLYGSYGKDLLIGGYDGQVDLLNGGADSDTFVRYRQRQWRRIGYYWYSIYASRPEENEVDFEKGVDSVMEQIV